MLNTGKFAGKTVLISGASRGIGKAIALKLAKDGANIVVAAKTASAHPKLPGTVYSAVEDIQKVGGKGLACIMDIRDEAAVQDAVESAVKEFGGIDILVNNASAISLTGTLETAMKRYDLMHAVNARGTFLLSQKCIPYLKQSKNAHIINISPPLVMEKQWFAPHVAYTMAKYGMSMCVLGMHEELKKYHIAVNALWPRTAIWTAAMEMLVGDAKGCRKPEIVADAAYVMLSRNSREFTGNFMIDEEVLKEEGVRDFDDYAVEPGAPLMSDFFVPGVDHDSIILAQKREQKIKRGREQQRVQEEKQGKQEKLDPTAQGEKQETNGQGGQVREVLAELRKILDVNLVQDLQAVFQFTFRNNSDTPFVYLDLKNGNGAVEEGISDDMDVHFEVDAETFANIFHGKVSPMMAFMERDLRVKGDMGKAMQLSRIIKKLHKSRK